MQKNLTPAIFQKKLLKWFDKHGRKDLPWQKFISPYRVWISEIMLQQTQVATVINYFQRFMQRFPTIASLATAELDDILHLWTGLGYYSRARNIHRSAQLMMQNHAGIFPQHYEDIIALPGIGPSTAGAIMAISMQKKASILDGNVKRVLTRLHGIDRWPGEQAVVKELWGIATKYTPENRVADYTQAIMDLGATLCKSKKPECERCPFQTYCSAYHTQQVHLIPASKKSKPLPVRKTHMLIMHTGQQQILLMRRPPIGVWANLWSFPEFTTDNKAQLKDWCLKQWGLNIEHMKIASVVRHTFSHFHLDITPIYLQVSPAQYQCFDNEDIQWYDLQQPSALGLPIVVKRFLNALTN